MMDDFGNVIYWDLTGDTRSVDSFLRFTLSDEACAARSQDEDLRRYGVIA